MFFFACRSVLFCVGCERSDFGSNFELHEAVADAWEATLQKIDANRPQVFGKLGYSWGHGEVVGLRSLLEHKFDPDEHVVDVCVTCANGAGAALSATVAHTSTCASNVKKQTTITAFFMVVTFAVVLRLYPDLFMLRLLVEG